MKSAIQELIDIVCEESWTPEMQAMGESAKAEFERLKEVVKTTRETRAAQKTYYDGGRLQGDLRKAKQWEIALDQRLARLWKEEPSADTTQERLL